MIYEETGSHPNEYEITQWIVETLRSLHQLQTGKCPIQFLNQLWRNDLTILNIN